MSKENLPESDARVRSQVKAAWKDFEGRNPVVAKELKNFGKGVKMGAEFLGDIVTLGGVTRKKKREEKEKKDKEII